MDSQDTQISQRHQNALSSSIANFHENFKSSLLLQDHMPDMLSQAPLVVNLLGQCRLLAYSESAAMVRMSKPSKRWEYLEHENLPSNLNQIVEQGQDAFDIADRNLRNLQMLAGQLFGKQGTIKNVFIYLTDHRQAERGLNGEMTALNDGLKECVEKVQEVEGTFEVWSKMARELSQSVTQGTHENALQKHEEEKEEAKAKKNLEIEEALLIDLEKRKKTLEKDAEDMKKVYMKANNSKHPEWKDLGLSLVGELSNTFLSAVNGVVDIAKSTPNVAVETVRAVGNLGSFGSVRVDPPPQAKSGNGTDTSPPSSGPSAYPDTGDPAYQKSHEIDRLVSDLKDLITNDLSQVVRDSDNSDLDQSLSGLKDCQSSLNENPCESRPFQNARAILKYCIDIGEEISSNQTEASELNDKKWESLVLKWKSRINDVANKATKLKTQATMQPGQAYGANIPVLRSRGPIDSHKILAQRHADLLTKQSAMLAAEANYEKSAKKFADNQASIIAITAKLRRLQDSKVTNKQIRQILLQTIESIAQMQTEIKTLVRYFNNISSVMDIICRKQCRSFLDTIRAAKDGGRDGRAPELSFEDWQAQEIFVSILTLRGHFAVVNDNARFYTDVSRLHILPAIRDINALPLSASTEAQEEARARLTERTIESAEAIRKFGNEKKHTIVDQLQRQIAEIGEETKLLPPLPEGPKMAIETGIEEVKSHVSEAIEAVPTTVVNIDLPDL